MIQEVKEEEGDALDSKEGDAIGDAGKNIESSSVLKEGDLKEEEPPKKLIKREGSRRKSEPRRAAESSVPGR